MYVIGQTGSGKSTLLNSCIVQDILTDRGFAFIDPHGDSAELIIDSIPKHRIVMLCISTLPILNSLLTSTRCAVFRNIYTLRLRPV